MSISLQKKVLVTCFQREGNWIYQPRLEYNRTSFCELCFCWLLIKGGGKGTKTTTSRIKITRTYALGHAIENRFSAKSLKSLIRFLVSMAILCPTTNGKSSLPVINAPCASGERKNSQKWPNLTMLQRATWGFSLAIFSFLHFWDVMRIVNTITFPTGIAESRVYCVKAIESHV